MPVDHLPSREAILEASKRIAPFVHHTPVVESLYFDQHLGFKVFMKCENLQKAGAFKSRGAVNAVFSLTETELQRGVATHSSGNHAQALARAAALAHTKAYIVMPSVAPQVKVNAVKEYGGEVIFCESTLEARESSLAKVVEQTGAVIVHPYNDLRVITGQATAAMELIGQVPDLDLILCPVGGGGLLSGSAASVHHFSPLTKLIACEPTGADDAFKSFKSKTLVPSVNPKTIADGLLTSLGSLTFPIIIEYVDDILTVNEPEIIVAMKAFWERMKMIIEPSSAVPLAVAMQNKHMFRGLRVGIILSGGNVDFNHLPWMEQK